MKKRLKKTSGHSLSNIIITIMCMTMSFFVFFKAYLSSSYLRFYGCLWLLQSPETKKVWDSLYRFGAFLCEFHMLSFGLLHSSLLPLPKLDYLIALKFSKSPLSLNAVCGCLFFMLACDKLATCTPPQPTDNWDIGSNNPTCMIIWRDGWMITYNTVHCYVLLWSKSQLINYIPEINSPLV